MKPINHFARRIKFLILLLLSTSLLSCTDEYVMDLIEFSVDALTMEDLLIGDYYQGGIIIALDDSGKHGLIAAVMDQGSSNPWWNGEFIRTNAVSTHDGKENTNKIVKAQGRILPYAAKICADFQYETYTDWFLPSKDQLKILYENRHLLEGLSQQLYWSSTEYETGQVWVQNFTTGEQHLNNTSDQAHVHTRAIREF